MFGFINVHEITTRIKDERFFIAPDNGQLSDDRILQFWQSISQTMKAMDERKKAKSLVATKETQTDPEILRMLSDRERERSATPRHSRGERNTRFRSTDREYFRATNYQNNAFRRDQNWRRY